MVQHNQPGWVSLLLGSSDYSYRLHCLWTLLEHGMSLGNLTQRDCSSFAFVFFLSLNLWGYERNILLQKRVTAKVRDRQYFLRLLEGCYITNHSIHTNFFSVTVIWGDRGLVDFLTCKTFLPEAITAWTYGPQAAMPLSCHLLLNTNQIYFLQLQDWFIPA